MSTLVEDFVVETSFKLPPEHFADAVTSDGHVVSFWDRPDGRVRFGWDGHADHPTLDGIGEMRDKSSAIFCSPDGAHIAYVGGRGGMFVVGRDATEDPPMRGFSRSVPPVFSHDGRHLVYGGDTDGGMRLFLDGQPIGDELAPIQAVFSPVGDRLAYVEMRGESRDDVEVRIVLDGAPGDWMTGMRNAGGVMQFSPDGRRFAYCRTNGKHQVEWVVDGVAQRAYDEVRQVGMAQIRGIGVIEPPLVARFSPDSRRFVYFADVPGKGVAIVEDGVPGPVVKGINWPVFSPDSRHLAYAAWTLDGRVGLVVDGALGPAWRLDGAGDPVFSGDGRHVALVGQRKEGGLLRKRYVYVLIVDGRVEAEVPGDDAARDPAFSPDGEHVVWWVRHESRSQVMIDGQPLVEGGDAIGEPVFTTSGHLVCPVQSEGAHGAGMVVDGRLGPAADGFAVQQTLVQRFGRGPAADPVPSWVVSPDGDHVAWIGQFGDQWRPVLDDQVGPGFFAPLATSFDARGRAIWYFQQPGEVYRVTAPA